VNSCQCPGGKLETAEIFVATLADFVDACLRFFPIVALARFGPYHLLSVWDVGNDRGYIKETDEEMRHRSNRTYRP
jgi:hypothetical protein